MIKPLASAVLMAMIMANPALADTFVQGKGAGRVIVNAILTDSPRGFDNHGHVTDIPDYDQDQVFVTMEYGVTADLTFILAPSYRHVSVEGEKNTSGLGYTEIGARYRLLDKGPWTVSAQGLLRVPGKRRADAIAQVGNTSTDVDLRLGAAYATRAIFVQAEGGYRFRSGDLPNEFHGDATLGANATDRLMLLVTVHNTIADGEGRGVFKEKFRYGDLYASAVYKVTNNLRLQAGYTTTFYGRNALKQHGPLIGVWFEF